MITAVDSSVLLDVFSASPEFGARSGDALRRSIAEGSLVVCDVVWAEVAGWFGSSDELMEAMEALGLAYDPMSRSAATQAGRAWVAYRRAGGTRTRVVADFLVGAHASEGADRLLSRDRGFYRRYFAGLTVLDPSVDN